MHPGWEPRSNFPDPLCLWTSWLKTTSHSQIFLPLEVCCTASAGPGLSFSDWHSGMGSVSLSQGLLWLCILFLVMRLAFNKAFLCNHMAPILYHLYSSYREPRLSILTHLILVPTPRGRYCHCPVTSEEITAQRDWLAQNFRAEKGKRGN